jgi:hypothetical protein
VSDKTLSLYLLYEFEILDNYESLFFVYLFRTGFVLYFLIILILDILRNIKQIQFKKDKQKIVIHNCQEFQIHITNIMTMFCLTLKLIKSNYLLNYIEIVLSFLKMTIFNQNKIVKLNMF